MILLDTHPLVWFFLGDKKLGAKTCNLIASAIDQREAAVSPISFWEIGMLTSKGRLQLGRAAREWTDLVLASGDIPVAQMSALTALAAGELPNDIHGDPADRLVIATSVAMNCPLVTADRKILAYAAAGHLQAIDARL